MKTSSLKPANQVTKNPSRAQRFNPSAALKAELLPVGEMDATEVTFVSQAARVTAVRRGAGVMIGDYFVGVTTGSDLLYSHPVIVY
jgi:hypothetical protein